MFYSLLYCRVNVRSGAAAAALVSVASGYIETSYNTCYILYEDLLLTATQFCQYTVHQYAYTVKLHSELIYYSLKYHTAGEGGGGGAKTHSTCDIAEFYC